MTILASGWELRCGMVRVVRVVVISLVTTHTGIGGIVIIAVDMAIRASCILVRSRQWPGTMIPKRGYPRVFGVAILASNRERHLGVIRIGGT